MALARRENLAVFHGRLRPVALTALTLLPLLSPSAGRAQELTHETHDDAVRARRGDQVLWENRHWSDRGGQLGGEIVGSGGWQPVAVLGTRRVALAVEPVPRGGAVGGRVGF